MTAGTTATDEPTLDVDEVGLVVPARAPAATGQGARQPLALLGVGALAATWYVRMRAALAGASEHPLMHVALARRREGDA